MLGNKHHYKHCIVNATMQHFLVSLYHLGIFSHILTQYTVAASEFHQEGDYLIGGIFDVHYVSEPVYHDRPEAINCSSQPFSLFSYLRTQLMRFALEEINNSTNLLPNVSLGFEIFDHCSDTENFPGILKLISVNGSIKPWGEPHMGLSQESKVIAVVGPFSSTDTVTTGPLFMADLIPLVSYGAASSVFSEKIRYPSFLRTVPSNKGIIEVIVRIIQHFSWRWVAFLCSDNDFGNNGLELFIKRIVDTDICLAYTKKLSYNTNHSVMFKEIEAQKIYVVIVFAPKVTAEDLIETAVQLNVTQKVWIAGDTWSLSERLLQLKGIQNIGTVLGVSQPVIKIPGFSQFIYSIMRQPFCKNTGQNAFCNQVRNCNDLISEEAASMDVTFSFPVYCAVYAIAHALHNALQCGANTCNGNIRVYPNMVLEELKKLNFTLLNQTISFDENGDPNFGTYFIHFWNNNSDAQEIGIYNVYPAVHFFINNTKIQWYTHGEVPTALCSPECPVGYSKKQSGTHECCFDCEICPNGTYINSTEDPYNCISCKDTEWSEEGSTTCILRTVEYLSFTDAEGIVIILGVGALLGLTLAMSALFAINYNTPVVRSAGGPMCFLILGCLSLCSVSVFFYFGTPTVAFCVLRFLPFLLFYTVCLACFVVRSFQIVCIFKIAAKFPMLHTWWMKYHGQWLVISAAFVVQALLLLIGYSYSPPTPYNDTVQYPDKTILDCDFNPKTAACCVVLLLCLCFLCFIFSYMGKDLPKNYNEAKAITFCLLLLIFTWIFFVTEYLLSHGKHIIILNALAILSSLYSFLLWYFLPKCYIIVLQPHKNTQQYFQGLIQSYTKTISQ